MEPSQASASSGSRPDFLLEKSDISDDIARESFISNNRVDICYPVNVFTGKCGTCKNSSTSAHFQGHDMTKLQNSEGQLLGNRLELNSLHICCLEVPTDLVVKPSALIRSDGSTAVPSCRNYVHAINSSPKHESGVEEIQ